MLVGRSGAGKTTLTQAMKGKKITYHKTQYINNYDVIIDTPGEYAENKTLARALVIYSYEADVVGLLMSAVEDYSLYSPNIVSLATRDVIGIVTQIDREDARVDLATMWLELAGFCYFGWNKYLELNFAKENSSVDLDCCYSMLYFV